MQLQIQEDLMASLFDFTDDGRSFCVEEFHADLYIRLFFCEMIQKSESLFRRGEVTGDDYVFSHVNVHLR